MEDDYKQTAPLATGQKQVSPSTAVAQPKAGLTEKKTTPEKEVILFNESPIIFSDGDTSRLQYLSEKLQHIGQEKLPVRLVYFGDSQIENDQITSALRAQFQKRYGGKGPGFVPLDAYYNTNHQLRIETSKNWDIKTFQDEGFINQSLLFKNTMLTGKNRQGWFRIRRIKNLNLSPDYQLTKLYYQAKDSCQVTVRQGRQTIYSGYLLPKEKVSTLAFQFNRTPDNIRFDFTSKDTLNISGLSLESGTGVLVDNIALRGLSYPTFSTSDKKKIGEMLDEVNVGLFVLHFGVNVVPYLSGNYRHFKNNFQRQLSFLKGIRPDVPILIIGVSDMAEKQGASFVPYANIPAIKAVQRQIAMENHVAFWDLHQFMGGQGGMVNWVSAEPPLARKDYAHFSEQGANAVGNELAEMIFKVLNTDSITAQ
jgi:hypothetical protein